MPPQWPPPAERRLLGSLAAKPISEILGVIYPGWPGACQSQGQRTWTFKVVLQPWRTHDGSLCNKPLLLRAEVINHVSEQLRSAMEPYQVHRFLARIGTDPADNSLVAIMEEHRGCADDADLAAAAEALKQPVDYHASGLGTFTLDRHAGWFSARLKWAAAEIDVHLCATKPDELAAASSVARSLFARADALDQQARAFAATQLLETRNNAWNADPDGNPEPALTTDQFCARLIPDSLSVYPDGKWAIWYNDGDLFWGHVVRVTASKDSTFKSASLAG